MKTASYAVTAKPPRDPDAPPELEAVTQESAQEAAKELAIIGLGAAGAFTQWVMITMVGAAALA